MPQLAAWSFSRCSGAPPLRGLPTKTATSSHRCASPLESRRLVEPRLSGGFAYRSCDLADESADLIPSAGCGSLPEPDQPEYRQISRDVQRFRGQVRELAETVPAAELHLTAIDRLLFSTRAGALDTAIDLLLAARSEDENPQITSDLSAALIVRAQATDNAADLLEAIRVAQQAPDRPEARFNEALATTLLGLRNAARSAWRTYVEVEPDPAWRAEGEARLERLEARIDDDRWQRAEALLQDATGASATTWGTHCERLPPGTPGALGGCPCFRHGVRRRPRKRRPRPRIDARRATALAAATALAEITGDASMREATRVLPLARGPAWGQRERALAQGLALFGEGRRHQRARVWEPGEPPLAEAVELLTFAGSELAHWARYRQALSAYQARANDRSKALVDEVMLSVSAEEAPTLFAHCLLLDGMFDLFGGRPEEALELWHRSLALFESHQGDRESGDSPAEDLLRHGGSRPTQGGLESPAAHAPQP